MGYKDHIEPEPKIKLASIPLLILPKEIYGNIILILYTCALIHHLAPSLQSHNIEFLLPSTKLNLDEQTKTHLYHLRSNFFVFQKYFSLTKIIIPLLRLIKTHNYYTQSKARHFYFFV